MPFDFLKRKKEPDAAAPAAAAAPPAAAVPAPVVPVAPVAGIPFDGLTEDWRLVGRMLVGGRLSDALNKRDPIAITDVRWASVSGSDPLVSAPGLKSVDPYDLVIVMAGIDSLPEMTDDERAAHRIHKVAYEVALEAPPYRVVGTVFLFAGVEPETLLSRSTDMFIPVVEATATMADRPIGDGPSAAILVNRAYLRGVEQIDSRSEGRDEVVPGSSMTP